MDVIEPNQESKIEGKEETKSTAPILCQFTKDQHMVIDVNLAKVSESADEFYKMRGFLDSMRDQAMALVQRMQMERAEAQRILTGKLNMNGHKSFVNKLFRR
jgi:hypothetical protein